MCQRIEVAERLQLIAKKLEAHGPRTGERIDIEDATAQRDLALLRYLGFGLVTLLFEPLDQILRIDAVPPRERADSLGQNLAWECALEQGHDAGDEDRGVMRDA